MRQLRILVSYASLIDPALVRALEGADFDAESVAADEVLSTIASCPIDAAILGATSPLDVELIRAVRQAAPSCQILAVADRAEADPPTLVDALRAGADGLALPQCPDDIVKPLQLLLDGTIVIPREVQPTLVDHITHHGRAALGNAHHSWGLTESEGAACALLERGLATREIAEKLHISPVTVRRHLNDAARKAGVHGQDQLRRALALIAAA